MGSTGTVLRELRGAQKSAKGVSLYSRYVNRPAGRVLAAGAYRAGVTPNQVTLTSALFTYGALAAVALVEPSWTLGVLVWAALAVGFAFDSADGQLARLTGRGGPDGEWLDHVVDCGKLLLVHAAVLISFYRFGELPSEAWLLLPLGFQLAAVVTFCAGLLREQLGKAAVSARGPSWAAPWRWRRPSRGCGPWRCCPPTTGCSAWCSCCSAHPGPSAPGTPRSRWCTRCSWRSSSPSGSGS